MPISSLILVGDSLTVGLGYGAGVGEGGTGTWAERLAEGLADITGIGPLLSSGFRNAGLGLGEFTFSGSWTNVASTDAFDLVAYGVGSYGATVNHIATFTTPTHWRTPIGYALYFIDYTGGGNFQYRLNGGNWTNHAQTLTHGNRIIKFYVACTAPNDPVTVGTSAVGGTDQAGARGYIVEFRGFNGSADCGVFPYGVEVFFSDPTIATQGFILHNFAMGAHKLNQLVQTTSGDRMAFFDAIVAGTGSPLGYGTCLGTLSMHINDTALNDTTQYNADLTTLYNRAHPLGAVGFINPWEIDPATRNATTQQNYRTQAKTTGTALSVQVLDLYDAWTANGWGTGVGTQEAVTLALGFLEAGGTHLVQAGHTDVAPRIYRWFRAKISSILPESNAFTVGSSQLASTDELAGFVPQSIVPPLLSNAPTCFSPGVTVGSVNVIPPLLNAAPTLFAPAPIQQVAIPQLSAVPTVFSPGVQQNIAAAQLVATPTVFSPAVTEDIATQLLNAAPTLFSPAVAPGSVSAVVPLLSTPPTFFAPTVTVGLVNVVAPLLNASPTVFQPTVTVGSISVTLAILNAGPTFFSPTVAINSVTVLVPTLNAAATFFTATVTVGQVQLVVPLLSAVATLFPPRVSAFVADAMPIHVLFLEQRTPRYEEQLAPLYRE